MVNSNAARHLLLVVTVLLCFFVYMGYRLWGQSPTPQVDVDTAGLELASLAPEETPTQTRLMTVNDSPSVSPPNVRAPISTPSGRPPALGGGEAIPDLGSMLAPPASREDNSPLSPTQSSPLKPPSGSIEESMGPAGSGGITGLVPDPDFRPGGELALSLPGAGSERRETPSSSSSPASAPNLLLPPDSLKPPSPSASELAPPSSSASAAPREAVRETPLPPARPETAGGSLVPPSPSGSGSLIPPARGEEAFTPPPSSSGSESFAPPSSARGIDSGAPGAASGTARPRSETPVRPATPSRDPAPPTAPVPGGGASSNSSASEDMRVYVIRPGDTLSKIASEELGSISLANNIFLFNRGVIDDPDHLIVGTRILLPARDGAGVAAGAPAQRPGAPGAVTPPPARPAGQVSPPTGPGAVNPGNKVHRVARGDTLSSIALRYYGSSAAWQFLYESNTDVVANPNRLTVGTELVIPPYGERR